MIVKPSSVLAVLLVALVALCAAAPSAGAETAPATKPQAAKQPDEPSAAERRAASSEFEREKLDQKAFDESERKASDGKESGGGGGGSVARAVFGLVVVLAAIYGVHWLLKKWGQSRLQGVAGRSGVIDVVATTPLAQGRALHLVRVGGELVLVGATEQSITRLGEVDASVVSSAAGDHGHAEFQTMLTGAMYGTQPGVPASMGGARSAQQPFLRRFVDNLRMSTAR